MVKKGIVRKVIDDKALVEVVGEEDLKTCDFNCEGCKFKNKVLLVDASISVSENDIVELFIENGKLFVSTFITFVLPLLSFMLGIFLGGKNELRSLLLGGIFVAIALIFAYIFDKHFNVRIIIKRVI